MNSSNVNQENSFKKNFELKLKKAPKIEIKCDKVQGFFADIYTNKILDCFSNNSTKNLADLLENNKNSKLTLEIPTLRPLKKHEKIWKIIAKNESKSNNNSVAKKRKSGSVNSIEFKENRSYQSPKFFTNNKYKYSPYEKKLLFDKTETLTKKNIKKSNLSKDLSNFTLKYSARSNDKFKEEIAQQFLKDKVKENPNKKIILKNIFDKNEKNSIILKLFYKNERLSQENRYLKDLLYEKDKEIQILQEKKKTESTKMSFVETKNELNKVSPVLMNEMKQFKKKIMTKFENYKEIIKKMQNLEKKKENDDK